MAKKTISNTFTVNTIDDPTGLVAQYCATATPTQSSQIHTSFQTGDLYMRTRTTEETFSGYVDPNHPWNKIVGESGGETDYQFAISANKVSQDGTSATAPTDISSSDWQNAPLIVTTAKPYLWSKVQKKDGNGNNVGNPSYMRLTGEESIEYSVEGALNTIKVGTGQTSTLVSCTYTFYQKPAVSSTRSTVSCYYAVYLRSGNTFSLLTMSTGYNNHGSGTSVTVNSNVPYKSGSVVYNAVVIYIFPSSYYSTSPESQNYMAKKEIPIVKDGDTAFVVDLENEMTNVALTEGGNTLTAVDFYFKVRAFYGTSNVLSDNECTVSASCSDSNVTLTTTAAKTTGIRVQVAQNVALANSTNITVTVTHTTYGTRTVIFTLAGVRGGENAVLQELLPSLDAISFARTAAGGLTPSSRNLTLSIKKTQGGSTSTQSISDSGLTIRWSSTSMPASKTVGNGWGNGTATGISWNSTTMQIANTVEATNIYIAAFNSAGTLVDRETIPVIKDGNNGADGNDGEDALTLALDTYTIAFPTDSDYNVESALTYIVGVKMFLGNDTQQTITSISHTSSDGGVTVSSISNGVRIEVGEETFVNPVTVTVTAVCSVGSRTAKIILTAAPKGAKGNKGNDGARGKVGRFFYFGGTFNSQDNDPTHGFVVNDAQAPYFEHTETVTTQSGTKTIKRYHVFNYETNGSYTMSQMWAISSNWNNKPWEVMTNDFKYIITEALFGAYAHLGSFIINGDWMISQYGVLVDSSGTETKVDGGGANPIVLYGNDVHGGTIIVRVQFTTSGTASITATANCEGNYDKGYVKNSGGSTLIEVSGTQSDTVNQSVSSGGYINLSYTKDGSVSDNDDKITFNISGVGYTLSLVSATSGMTYTGSSSSGGVIPSSPYTYFDPTDPTASTAPSSGYKFRPAFAVDGLTGKTYQNDAYIRGEIHATSGEFTGEVTATSGTIGGFTIDTDRLYNSNWNAGIDINYDSKNVRIGKNAQGASFGEDAIIRAENTKVLGGGYNTALYLNASGATNNYAFYGSGNGVLNGFMQGYKVHVLTLIGAATYLNLNNGQVQAIASVGTDSDKTIYLPTLGNCRNTLGISVNNNTVNFNCCITIINQSAIQNTTYNRDNVYVRGGSHNYTDEITNLDTRPVVLAQGNPKSMIIMNCTTCYVVITYINKRFIANYITTTW